MTSVRRIGCASLCLLLIAACEQDSGMAEAGHDEHGDHIHEDQKVEGTHLHVGASDAAAISGSAANQAGSSARVNPNTDVAKSGAAGMSGANSAGGQPAKPQASNQPAPAASRAGAGGQNDAGSAGTASAAGTGGSVSGSGAIENDAGSGESTAVTIRFKAKLAVKRLHVA